MIKVFWVGVVIGLMSMLRFAAAQELPKDVISFLEERESCDHWRGEEGYDKERRAEIDWSVCQSCQGTDSKLASLKKKYRADKASMEKLSELKLEIEPVDKAAARRFCRSLKKPKSLDEGQ